MEFKYNFIFFLKIFKNFQKLYILLLFFKKFALPSHNFMIFHKYFKYFQIFFVGKYDIMSLIVEI